MCLSVLVSCCKTSSRGSYHGSAFLCLRQAFEVRNWLLPPSNLPRWTEFNDLLLESLCESIAEYSQNRQPSEEMLNLFRQRRDKTRFMAPDFQAQLLEEEIGADYFDVWQSLKTDVYEIPTEEGAIAATLPRLTLLTCSPSYFSPPVGVQHYLLP